MKYDISDEINEILRQGVYFKRRRMYDEANKIYDQILKIDGPSGLLYIAMAKTYACQMRYNEAIRLLKLANKACLDELGIEDPNCLMHIHQLENRNRMSRGEFLEYMRKVAGNSNYNFPGTNF